MIEILGSGILAIAQSILFYNKTLGMSVIIFVVLINAIITYILKIKGKIQNKNGFLLLIPIILLSCTYFIFASKIFYVANIFVIIGLNLLMYVVVTNKYKHLGEYLINIVELILNTITNCEDSIAYTKNENQKYIKIKDKNKIKKTINSIIIVAVVVGIIVALLASADSIFAGIFTKLSRVLERISISDIFNIVLRIAIIAITYIIFLSLILTLKKDYISEEDTIENNNRDSFTIKLLLVILNIVYLVFCYIQISSLFAKVNLKGTFNYADYARNGFFQLMAVSLINFVIILISSEYREEKIIRILNVFLVVFTIVIAISSMYRMYMYQEAYGLTYLRFFVYVILFTEIISFVPIIMYIFNNEFDFFKWVFIIVTAVYCGINYMNIEKLIVSQNINKETSVESVDYKYISSIASEDSYEILENKLIDENIDEETKENITNILQNIEQKSNELSWQEFNISKWKAR